MMRDFGPLGCVKDYLDRAIDPLISDLFRELPDGRVIGAEFKADAAPSRDSARLLLWLADRLEDRFVAGLVFHTGPRAYRLDARVLMLPICALWG